MKTLTLLFTLLLAISAGAQRAKYTTFSPGPNAKFDSVVTINDSGQVLGWWPTNGEAFVISPGDVWTKNIVKTAAYPLTMNNAAAIIGTEKPSNQAFYKLWEQPAVQFRFGNGTTASAINTAGYIAGVLPASYFGQEEVYLEGPQDDSFVHVAFPNGGVGISGTMGLNNLNQIVGSWATYSNPWSGFFYDSTSKKLNTTFNMPGAVTTNPVSINDNQEVVGNWIDANNVQHGFYWNPTAGFSNIDVAGDTYMQLIGINNQSVILGVWLDHNTPELAHYVTIVGGHPAASINVPKSQAGSTVAAAINNVGQVVGTYETQEGVVRGFIYTPSK
jgi:probable HAF family extracellular repeat protein